MSHNEPYQIPVAAAEGGMDGMRLAKVSNAFLKQQADGAFPGGQLVVRRHGKVVLNVACGTARGWHGRGGQAVVPVTASTPFAIFSTGKPFAAMIIAWLEAQGKLDLQATVASILPDFGTLGREAITIFDVLTHRGGIILPGLAERPGMVGDREAVWQYLLQTAPRYPRGTFAYMPTEYGIILDRLVSVLVGKSMAQLLNEVFAEPLGLSNFQYGLGPHQREELAWNYWLGKPRYMVAEMNVADDFEGKNNSAELFTAANPAFGMVSDAANLAAFYAFLLGDGRTPGGNQIIPPEVIRRYTTRQVSGWNRSVNTYLSLGHGFMLGTPTPSFYGWWGTSGCFGHPGMFSSIAFGDHDTQLAVAIVTNGNRGIGDFFRRTVPLAHGLRRACR